MNEERKARHESKIQFIKPKIRQEAYGAHKKKQEEEPKTPPRIEIKPKVAEVGQNKRRGVVDLSKVTAFNDSREE